VFHDGAQVSPASDDPYTCPPVGAEIDAAFIEGVDSHGVAQTFT